MKKYILTSIILLLAAANTAWGQVAKIGTTEYTTLAEAVTAATAGQTIELIDDVTLTSTISINKGITIDGGNHTVTKTSAGVAFELTGSNDVTFTNLSINATNASGRAIQAGNDTENYSGNLTVSNSTLTAGQRGVSIYEPGGNINLAISNTTIQCSFVTNPTTEYNPNDSRGVALWSYDGHVNTVTLDDVIIKGFSYCINVGGTGKISNLTMTGGSTYGRAAINNHGKNGTFNLTGVDIHGLNNQTGPTEAFACIVDDTDAANNTYNISNCTITSIISAAASSASGSNASQYLVDLRGSGSTANITNGTTYSTNNTDRGGLIEHYSNLDTHLGNTINFDAATYQIFDAVYDFANVPCLNTTGNTLTYTGEVFYYRSTQSGYQGTYCTFAEPFVSGDLDNGEFIQLQRDVTLTDDITWQKGDGNSFYLELNGHSLSRDANAQVPTYIQLNEGVTVYSDVEIDGLLLGLDNCPIAKFANTDATYKYKYTVVAEGSIAHINGTLYPSLTAAVAAAQDGDVIELIADDDVSLVEPGSEIIVSKPITITGPVGDEGLPLFSIYGSSTGALDNNNFNDLLLKCTTGTVTISNLSFAFFGDEISSVTGHSPIFIGSANKKVVLDNVHICYINCEGVHINGGEFEITNCVIDCYKETDNSDYTKGICVVNEATGSITGTKIENVTNEITTSAMAGIELQGKGPITISDCEISTNDAGKCIGICADSAEDYQLGESSVTVSNTTVTSPYYTLYGNGTNGALISVTSGTYNGPLGAEAGTDSQGLSISGGTFDAAVPEEYCAPGYIPTDADPVTGKYTVKVGAYVAELFDSNYDSVGKYETLADAFVAANAASGSTLTLLTDVNVTNDDLNGVTDIPPYLVTGDFTLDLDGNKITYTGTSTLSTGIIGVKRGGNLTVDDASTPSTGEINSGANAYAAITMTVKGEAATGDAATLTVESGTIIGDYYAITGNGSRHNTEITIKGGVIKGNHTNDNLGIYHPQNGTLTIIGGEITGYSSAIEVRSGTLNVTGGTFETTATSYSCNPNGSGTTTVGAAIAIAQHTTNQPINATISGGTFTIPSTGNAVKLSVSNPQNNSFSNVTVSGLTDLIGTSNVIPDGYAWSEANGISTLTLAVAKIGDTNYATLAAAVTAAQAGQTIELLTDINLTDPQTINKEVTIDGGTNQYTITSAGNPAAIQIAGAGNITLKNLKVTNEVYNGVQISENANYSGKLTIDNCVITVGKRGVNVVGIASSFSMDITNSTIQSTVDDPTTTYLDDIDSRGISLSDNLQEFTTVNINNTIIQGFYDINAADTRKYLKLTMTGGKTYGRAAVNNYGDYNTFTLNGVEIHGLNNQTNPAQSFACIVDNTYATNNTYNIIGCTFTATISDAAINEDNSTASEQMLALRGTNAKVNITSNTTYTTTCTDKSRVGLLEDESRVADPTYNNIVTLDADALSSLTGVINDLTTLVAEYDGQSKYKLVPGSPSTVVAKIGDTEYTTLEEAFAAVQNGETITMLTDYTLATPMDLTLEGKVVTLDLGGKTLTGRTNLKSGNLTIQNGTVAGGEQQALNVYGSATAGTQNYSVLTIASNVTVTADQFGVCMFGPTYNSKPGYGAVINIAGTVHTTGTGAEGAVFVSGNLGNNIVGDMNNVINVTGTITSDTDAAIALNGNATVNVQNGAVITGNTAIAIKRGTLNVTGGTVHATGISQIPPSGNLNGTEMTGAAVSMTNTYNQYGAMQVNISGGSFTSDHAMALYKEDDNYTNTAKYAVSGGIFSTAVPEEFCADGYVPTSITTQGLTQYTVEPGDFVAQIGETKYTTLAAAVAAVPTNGLETTITLLKDISLTERLFVNAGATPAYAGNNNRYATTTENKNIILELDGHNIESTSNIALAGGSLNITNNGTADATHGVISTTAGGLAPIEVRGTGDLTKKRTLTIGTGVTLSGAEYGLNIFGSNDQQKNIIDVNVNGTVNGMLFVLGNLKNADNEININVNGTVDAYGVTGTGEAVHSGIALGGNANVTVADGATVKGESGIEVRAGSLTVNGGTITATSADYSYTANNNGMTTKGAAIAVAQHGTLVATSANILGGTLNGTKLIAVKAAQNNSLAGVTVIADDSFVTNTETVLPDDYYWLSNGDGTSSPAPNSAVAQIGNTLYSTLAAAVAAVPADGTPTTITLLQDINLTERLFVNAGASPAYAGSNNRYATTTENKNITLELDGHNIVSSSNIALAGGSLNITNNGTADATHGVISTTAGGLAPVEVRGTGDLTKKRTLTVGTGVTLSGAEYGLNIFGSNDQQKNIIDVNVNGTVNGMLFVLGNLKNADNEININVNGTVDASGVTGTDEAVHSGIALGGNANVTVANGATVKGESGIEVRAGNLTVNGGTIEATVADYSYTANNNGMTTKGAAIAVAQHSTVRPIDVTLNGGTLTGIKKIAVNDVNGNDLTDVSVVASNSFVANEADTEIPAGFIWVDNGNNTKKLVLAPVRRNDVGYATLAEAIAAVENNDIIKLFADITLTDDIACTLASGSTFTIDFNNHNVIRNGNHVVLAEGVSILTNVAASQLFAAEGDNVVVESNSGNTDYPYEYSVKKSIANAGITISVNSATYTGEVQTPTVTVKDGNNVLVAGTHYTISYKGSELKNANTYVEEIIITGIGDYAGTKTADFTINKRNINDVTVEGHSQTYTTSGYTTSQIEGLIKLKYNDIPLVVSTDYTIAVDDTKTYKDSGTYPEVITLTAVPGGNFEGSRKVNFYIGGAKDITTSNIIATVVYNGSAQVPSEATVTVKDGNTNQPLTLGTDFTLEYFQYYEYINAQTYVNAITIVGIGTYYGTKTVDYIITPKDISGCIINNSTPFTGAVIDPATVVTVKDGNTTLSSTDDYTLTVSQGHTYQNPQTYGNAITITGKGNYTGTKTMDFIITQTDAINLATAAVVISKQTYTGADLKPTAATTTVTVNGAALDPANYTFSFVPEGDNFYKDAKVYSNAIIITASTTQSTYYGTVVGNYIIEPRDLSDTGVTVTATELAYNTAEQDVVVTVKYGNNTIPAANYTFTPTTVTEAGLYDVTVTAVENSNLVGSRTVVLKVTKALDGTYASDFTVSPDPIPTQTETGNEIKPVIVVKDKDRVMTSGVDYTVAYTNNINAGTATITITGTGAYSGTKTINFTIVAAYFTENGITYHHANEGEEVSVGNSGKTLAVNPTVTGNPVAVPQTVTHDNKTYTVTGVEQNAFSSTAITGIVLPKSIEEVENGAFSGANNLRYVDLSTATGFTPSSLQRNIAASPFYDVPKQALVFLNGTTFTGENYVYNPGSGNDYYCEVFKIYDDLSGAQTGFGGDDYKWAFENPHPFTAYSVENTRQLTAERHYTICLPYALEIPNNVKAYTLEATSDKLFGFKEVTGTLAAYTPYVLIPTKSGQLLGSNNNTVVPAFPATNDATKLNDTAAGNFTMYGTMRYMEGADAQGKYIMQYNNGNPTWKQITATNAGFTSDNKACILPMRAYIVNNTSGSREFFDVVFTNIDGTTLTFDKVTFDDDTIYDLSGRKVELLERGHTYIINGKKVLVK